MRGTLRIAPAALVLALLAPIAPPAAAAVVTTVVRGHGYVIGGNWNAPDLAYWSAACSDPGVKAGTTIYALARRNGTAGTHAIGFGFRRAGSEAGVLAYVDDPATLSTFNIDVDTDGSGTGHAHAYLRRADGWYVGTLAVSSSLNGWANWQGPDLAGRQFGWRFQQNDGTWLTWSATGTIAQMASADAGVTFGRVGVLFGCGGRDYYIDQMRVSTATSERRYDFEELGASVSHLSVWQPRRRKVMRDARRWRIDLGGAAWLGGDATLRGSGDYFWDTGVLAQRPYGARRWTTVRPLHRAFSTTGYAWWKVRPQRTTQYRFSSDGTAAGRSTSRVLVVEVRARVRARTDRRKVRTGNRILITGSYLPRTAGVLVTVQGKSGGGWRPVASGRTRGTGGFALRPRAGAPGRWVLRVVTASGRGNIGNTTGQIVVTVLPKPKPKPPAGCRSGCSSSTPAPESVPVANPTPAPDYGVLPGARRVGIATEFPRQTGGGTRPPVPAPRTPTAAASAR